MERDEALKKLEKTWREEGVVGAAPTLWDLALALARAGVTGPEEGDESPAGPGEEDPALPKAE